MIALLAFGALWIILNRVPSDTVVGAQAHASLPEKGFIAPDFTLQTLDGKMVTLSDLRGQVVLVNFWATWCPPCRAEMPAMQQAYDQYRTDGFVVLAVNMLEGDAQVTDFVYQTGLTFPVLVDKGGGVSERYQVKSIPTTYFVDREGVIQDVIIGGPIPRAMIESKVTALLAPGGGE